MSPGRRALLAALFLLALAATVLHLAAHPVVAPDKEHAGESVFRASFVAAALLPLLDLVVVTWLFSARRTAPLGLLVNGVIVIYGTVLMGHFAIVQVAGLAARPATFTDYLFASMFLDFAIVWADFFAGRALYESWLREA